MYFALGAFLYNNKSWGSDGICNCGTLLGIDFCGYYQAVVLNVLDLLVNADSALAFVLFTRPVTSWKNICQYVEFLL